ncbi:MAG: phenylacetate--CoA ligase family protein [Fimbriimonadaceae bacterium]|nr:phenylacetate--CoA ligase family protein [Fimbriimonadaceae bacterium]
MSFQKRLLDQGPHFVAEALIAFRGYRQVRRVFTPSFEARMGLQRESQRWTKERLEAYRLQKVQALVKLAFEHTPYYREAYTAVGFEPGDLKTLADYANLPTIDKRTVLDRGEDMVVPAARATSVDWKTSGTTGQPMHFRLPPALVTDVRMAHIYTFAEWFGIRPRDTRLTLGGRYLGVRKDGAIFWNPAERQLAIGVHSLNERTVGRAVRALWRRRPKWIQGHPTAVGLLVELAGRAGLELPKLDLFCFTGENLTDETRDRIVAAFGCRVQGTYGQGEQVAIAGSCEEGRYHANEIATHFELVAHPSGLNEIVGTALDNDAMPFLRYRTSDLAEDWCPDPCACGRTWRSLPSVVGRIDHTITATDGSIVLPVQIRTDFSGSLNLPAYSVVQKREPGSYAIRLYSATTVGQEVESHAVQSLKRWVGADARVTVEYADPGAAMTTGGKHRTVIKES